MCAQRLASVMAFEVKLESRDGVTKSREEQLRHRWKHMHREGPFKMGAHPSYVGK